MGLTNINSVADRLVDQMRALGAAVVYVSDTWSGGDLPRRQTDAIERSFCATAETAAQVLAEAQANPAAVEAAFDRVGWDGTLVDFADGVASLQAKSGAWYDLVLAEIYKLPPESIVSMVTRNGLYRETSWLPNFPEATGLVLKNSAELAALRAELVTLGAIDS